MRAKMPFTISDVFADEKYSGNPLATFIVDNEIADSEMQQIAREIHFSETTFILSRQEREGGYDVRIFTPAAEVDFAGHPTLGTADVIRRCVLSRPTDRVALNLKAGQVPVRFSGNDGPAAVAWMRQIPSRFGAVLDAKRLARVLGLEPNAVDSHWPVEEVSTGLHHIIVPLTSLGELKKVKPNLREYDRLIRETWAKVILAFCPGGYRQGHDLAVRVFPISLGIFEDPATGSGNGCLAAYLVRHRYFGKTDIDIQTGQGYEIGRPSTLHLRAGEREGAITVEVGGRVIPVASGLWD